MSAGEVCGNTDGPGDLACLGPAGHPASTMHGNGPARWWSSPRHVVTDPEQPAPSTLLEALWRLVDSRVLVIMTNGGRRVGLLTMVHASEGLPDALLLDVDDPGPWVLVPWPQVATLQPCR